MESRNWIEGVVLFLLNPNVITKPKLENTKGIE